MGVGEEETPLVNIEGFQGGGKVVAIDRSTELGNSQEKKNEKVGLPGKKRRGGMAIYAKIRETQSYIEKQKEVNAGAARHLLKKRRSHAALSMSHRPD